MAENVVSIGETRVLKATCWSAAIRIAFSEVNVYCGGTAFIAAWRAASVCDVLTKSTARGATMSRVASWPTVASRGASGRMSAPRMAVRARIRIPAAIATRGMSWREKRAEPAERRVSMAWSLALGAQCVPTS